MAAATAAFEDLSTLVQRSDHLGVLRHVRLHKLREPELVLKHGLALLGKDLKRPKTLGTTDAERLAVLEQVCLASLDVGHHARAEECLSAITNLGVARESARFRRLLGLCLEAAGDVATARDIYESLLKENPSNVFSSKRLYCLLKSSNSSLGKAKSTLNSYLEFHSSDVAAWAEMMQLCQEQGDYAGAAYCAEEVVLSTPIDATAHVQLAEAYATCHNLELARKHYCQALELHPQNVRALYGLVAVTSEYLETTPKAEAHQVAVVQELLRWGGERLVKAYGRKSPKNRLQKLVQTVVEAHTSDLSSSS